MRLFKDKGRGLDWKAGFPSKLYCGPICIPVLEARQSWALAVLVPQPHPCRRSSSQTSALLRHGLIAHQTVEVQTLIMQESAGHQPKISGPQLELVIPAQCSEAHQMYHAGGLGPPCTVVVLRAVVYFPSKYLSGSLVNKDGERQ